MRLSPLATPPPIREAAFCEAESLRRRLLRLLRDDFVDLAPKMLRSCESGPLDLTQRCHDRGDIRVAQAIEERLDGAVTGRSLIVSPPSPRCGPRALPAHRHASNVRGAVDRPCPVGACEALAILALVAATTPETYLTDLNP